MKQNCGAGVRKATTCAHASDKYHQIIVSRQVHPNLRDDDGKFVGCGKLDRKLLAVLVVELLRAAHGKELHGNCGGTRKGARVLERVLQF
jgi:hypothetical protein